MTTIATSKDAMSQAKIRMEKAVEDFRKELGSVRTGRAAKRDTRPEAAPFSIAERRENSHVGSRIAGQPCARD